jgi:hypothetical protein
MVGWWPGDGDANDIIGDNDGALQGDATFASGMVGQAFSLDGSGDYVRVPTSEGLNPTGSFTLDAWIFAAADAQGAIIRKWGDSGDYANQRAYALVFLAGGTLVFGISDDAHQNDTVFHGFVSPSGSVALNVWSHVAAVYDQSTGTRRIYVNGVQVAERTDDPITITDSAADLGIGGHQTSSTTAAEFFSGMIDEVEIFNRALTGEEIASIYNAGSAGKCKTCTISCPEDIVQSTEPDQCSAVVSYSEPAGSSSCSEVTCAPPSGSTFQKGTTTVTCSEGGGASCSFSVTVNDTQAPDITCPGDITTETSGTCAVVNYSAPGVSDNCSGVGAPNCSPASGSCFPVGTTTVTCSVADGSGNQAQCSLTVTVNQTEAECVITCSENREVSTAIVECSAVVNYPAPETSGGCGTVSCTPPSGSTFPRGVTMVTCTSTAGSSCSFTVTVNDTQPPSIRCPGDVTTVVEPGVTSAAVSYASPVTTDNCGGATVVCTPPSGSTFALGSSTVTCQATDSSGNTASCSFRVTVADFDICLQNDSNPGTVLVFSSMTGAYRFCCGGQTFSGTGKVVRKGKVLSLSHNTFNRRLQAKVNLAQNKGTAVIQTPPGVVHCTITDRNLANNSCVCE